MSKPGENTGSFRINFTSRRSLLPILRFTLHATILDAGFNRSNADDMETVLDEALTNIIEHTYQDKPNRKIELSLHFDTNRITMVLGDRGPSFNPLEIPDIDMVEYLKENRSGGLGVHMIRSLLSEISYLPREGGGNILMMTKLAEDRKTDY